MSKYDVRGVIHVDSKGKFEAAILAGVSSLPYVGGGISSLYSSIKADKETQRVDKFFEVISVELERLDAELIETIKSVTHDEEYLTMLIENVCRKVEKEARNNKQDTFECFFINSLLNGVTSTTYDLFDFFLNALDSLLEIDIQVIVLLHKEDKLIPISKINSGEAEKAHDPYYILASVNKLRSFGFVESYTGDFHVGAKDNDLNQEIKISHLGKDFTDFCLRK